MDSSGMLNHCRILQFLNKATEKLHQIFRRRWLIYEQLEGNLRAVGWQDNEEYGSKIVSMCPQQNTPEMEETLRTGKVDIWDVTLTNLAIQAITDVIRRHGIKPNKQEDEIIVEIRNIRNAVTHGKFQLSDDEFSIFFRQLTNIMIRAGDNPNTVEAFKHKLLGMCGESSNNGSPTKPRYGRRGRESTKFSKFDVFSSKELSERSVQIPVIVHVENAQKFLQILQRKMKNIGPSALENSRDIHNLRKKFIRECEKTFIAPECRSKMYEILWKNAYYSSIFVYFGAWQKNQRLKARDKESYKTFALDTKAYLLRLVKAYPDLSYPIFNSIGDIHRYSSELLKNHSEIKEAINCYGYAVKAKPNEGHPFNQLGFLLCADSPWNGVIMFLRAGITAEPHTKALDHLKMLKPEMFEKFKEISLKYVNVMTSPFDALSLNDARNEWTEQLKYELKMDKPDNQMILEAFSAVVLGSLNAIDKEKSECQRFLIKAISEDFKLLFKELGDRQRNTTEESTEDGYCSQDDEDTDDYGNSKEDESTEDTTSGNVSNSLNPVFPLLALLFEWYNFVDTRVIDKRPPAALKMSLQTMCQMIVDNANEYIQLLQVTADVSTSSSQVIWLLNTPCFSRPESFYYELIPVLLKSAETWTSFPIHFDGLYKIRGEKQGPIIKVNSTMREMALLRLKHASTAPPTIKEFKIDALMVQYSNVVDDLHRPRSACTHCGISFPDKHSHAYLRHLEMHLQNLLSVKENQIPRPRPFFMSKDEWINFDEFAEHNSKQV